MSSSQAGHRALKAHGEQQVPILRPATLPAGHFWHEVDTPYQTIGFMLRRSRRKTIGLRISDDGLIVTSPNWVQQRHVMQAVQAKAPWILAKLRALHERRERDAAADGCWRDEGAIPYLGSLITVALQPALRHPQFSGDPASPMDGDVLALPLPADSTDDQIRAAVHTWLHERARIDFEKRLHRFSAVAGIAFTAWRLASARTRWGSCSSTGRIMLNWRLIHFPADVVDYVVAHEIAHLRHMNHGPSFWREVARLYPGYELARQSLKPHHPGSMPLF